MARFGGCSRRRASRSKKSLFAAEQGRPDVARRRLQWKKYQSRFDPRRLVFIDETWAKTNMTRRRGRALRGRRLVAKVPHGRWRTLTFLAALRCDRITAPCVIDGPINGLSFLAYVEQILLPTLTPGDIVIMDNLGSHKRPGDPPPDPNRRRQAVLSAALLTRPQPDRAGLCQAQNPPAQGRRTNHRGHLETHWFPPRLLHPRRVRQLS